MTDLYNDGQRENIFGSINKQESIPVACTLPALMVQGGRVFRVPCHFWGGVYPSPWIPYPQIRTPWKPYPLKRIWDQGPGWDLGLEIPYLL